MKDTVHIPLLDELAHNGFFYGGLYIVEFDPDSLWYETSLTIAALAMKRMVKVEYHVFEHFPREAREALSKLANDAKFGSQGLLSIVDSYTQTMEYEKEEKKSRSQKSFRVAKTRNKPLDLVKSADNWAKEAKAGYTDKHKRWLHIDDNTGIFLRYNDEKTFIDKWRTGIIPYSVRARESPHLLAFPRKVASDWFYSQFESFCDGIIELKTTEEDGGGIENCMRVRLLRGKTFDSTWHRLELSSSSEVTLGGVRMEQKRRLAAIMFTDIEGYTALTHENESRAFEIVKKHRETLRPMIIKHGGKEVKTMGDAFLVEFSSALAAIECAVDIQSALAQYNKERVENLRVRIGIHIGDVIHEDGDVYGDAVNIASRIEPLAKGGGTCISQQVYDQIRNKTNLRFTKLEPHELKNVSTPIDVYELKVVQ